MKLDIGNQVLEMTNKLIANGSDPTHLIISTKTFNERIKHSFYFKEEKEFKYEYIKGEFLNLIVTIDDKLQNENCIYVIDKNHIKIKVTRPTLDLRLLPGNRETDVTNDGFIANSYMNRLKSSNNLMSDVDFEKYKIAYLDGLAAYKVQVRSEFEELLKTQEHQPFSGAIAQIKRSMRELGINKK